MRKFFSFIAILAIVFLTGQAFAEEGGTVRRITGKHLNMNATYGGATATLDTFSFGFESKWVRVCLNPESVITYFRFGTATADRTTSSETSQTGGSYITADYTTDRMTVPASSSAVFIGGQTGSFPFGRAVPMYASNDKTGSVATYMCTEQPWRTKGIVTHIVSGLATVDVWAW